MRVLFIHRSNRCTAPRVQGLEIEMSQAEMKIWEVAVNAETGEWLREPKATEETAELEEFLSRQDTSALMHTTYESPFDGGTRLLRAVLQ